MCREIPGVSEGNPLMRSLLSTSLQSALTLKMGAAALFTLVMAVYSRQHFTRSFIITSVIALIYALLTGWHLVGIHLTIWYLSLAT